ncbi:uncharacterized protein LOC113147457 [Cyclospora cayetanensis]|uniref:Uncharacterized protein LOC113147457 n=1 Tax=Cyclospora cayetanensis TaxID=88456 RepID=A0A6P6S3N3_9EIME|nr:uncharacterized protein LOC113147457 [Cyclospora cayetanensis]
MDCKAVLTSEGVVEPLFQLLVHKVTIEKFDLLRDLAKKKALPDCAEDSEEFFEHGTVLFLGSFGQAAGLELQLWLCPNGDREDWDALTITISNEGLTDLPDVTKLTLLDARDEYKEISSCETVGICRAKRGYVRFFFNWTDHNILRVGSRLVLKVEMRFLRRLLHIDAEPNRGATTGSLQCDVFDYLSEKYFKMANDRVLVQVGSRKMLCSKALLSCRSPVFESMFSGSFKEANSSFIALKDMDTDVAAILIDWIQEDRLPETSGLNWSKCMRVLMAADKFQVHTLVDYCICHLRRLLTQGNVSFDEIIVVRKMLQQCTGSKITQLGKFRTFAINAASFILRAARDCEAYVAARAACDPSKMWSILDLEMTHDPLLKPCRKGNAIDI